MATWQQRREMEELKKRDPATYERLMAARQAATSAMGLFDSNLDAMNAAAAGGGLALGHPAAAAHEDDGEPEEDAESDEDDWDARMRARRASVQPNKRKEKKRRKERREKGGGREREGEEEEEEGWHSSRNSFFVRMCQQLKTEPGGARNRVV